MSDHRWDRKGVTKLPIFQVDHHHVLLNQHCTCFRQRPEYPAHHTFWVQCVSSTLSLHFCYTAETAGGQGAASLPWDQKVDLAFVLETFNLSSWACPASSDFFYWGSFLWLCLWGINEEDLINGFLKILRLGKWSLQTRTSGWILSILIQALSGCGMKQRWRALKACKVNKALSQADIT